MRCSSLHFLLCLCILKSHNIFVLQAEPSVVNCIFELIHANEALEDLEYRGPVEKSHISDEVIVNGRSLAKSDAQKIFAALDPKVEKTLLDCLRKKDLMFLISGEEKDSKNWYTKYLDIIYSRPGAFRGRELIQSFGEASPLPSPAAAPSIPVVPEPWRHTSPPSPPFFPRDFSNSNLQPTFSEQSSSGPSSSSDVQANKQKSTRETVVIAVAVTAAATFVLSALLFLCCRRICGTGSGLGKNDERPLLSLSLNDYSIGI